MLRQWIRRVREQVGSIDAAVARSHHLDSIAPAVERIERDAARLEPLASQLDVIGKNVEKLLAEIAPPSTDLNPIDGIEHTTYLTDQARFQREQTARPYVFGSVPCRSDFFLLPLYNYWCSKIRQEPVFLRKQWEFVYIAHALYERGLLEPGRRGVGFGVGTEPLVDLFASMGCEVLATDLAAEEAEGSGWIETAQHASSKNSLAHGLTDPEQFERLVSFRPVNMNKIPTDLRDFDFCYSSCSIEHVGTLDLSKQFLENVLDVLKPGGISIHTTEFVINSNDETVEEGSTVLWRKRDFEEVAARLRAKGHFVEPLDFYTGRHAVDRYVDLPPFGRGEPHLRLLIGHFKCTSFGMIVRKAG